jgi:hypothetical protein
MSEIKEGDIVIVNGYAAGFGNSYSNDDYDFFDNQRGMVKSCSYLDKKKIEISPVNAIGKFYKKTYLVHIKQCRKLVKVRKCDCVNGQRWLGSKEDYDFMQRCSYEEFVDKYIRQGIHFIMCPKCNGTGKIKV